MSTVFAALDERDLLVRGLLTAVEPNGMRFLHKRLANDWCDAEYGHLPLLPIGLLDATGIHSFESIPDRMESMATLVFLGYREGSSRGMWLDWLLWKYDSKQPPSCYQIDEFDPNHCAIDVTFPFHATLLTKVRVMPTDCFTEHGDDAWYNCMDTAELGEEFQAYIMNPDFYKMRREYSCVYWIINTMETRLKYLRSIRYHSQKREDELMEAHEAEPDRTTMAASERRGTARERRTTSSRKTRSGAESSVSGCHARHSSSRQCQSRYEDEGQAPVCVYNYHVEDELERLAELAVADAEPVPEPNHGQKSSSTQHADEPLDSKKHSLFPKLRARYRRSH